MTPEQAIDVIDRLARIETKLDARETVADDHETRIRSLETFRNWGTGFVSLGAILAGALKALR